MADSYGLVELGALRKHELIFEILRERPAQRHDVRQRRAGNPARRIRLPAVAALQLSALSGGYLRLAIADPPVCAAGPAIWWRAKSARRRTRNGSSRC